ncbi:MAG: molecular chaperone DnaJ [Myxococcales bacterium]|nr:molecular chaperone DnaJ [Myxococcales bacterium]
MKDPYELLGVPRTAAEGEIKGAFRRLAKEHHPDRNPGDDASARHFKELNAAYQILSDPDKRAMFDRFGAAGLGGARSGGAGPFGNVPIDLGELNIDGIFGDLLDALGIRVGDRGDIKVDIELSFSEAVFGCKKTVAFDRVASCVGCDGTGAAAGTEFSACASCNGRGRVRMQQGVFPIAVERACPACHGSGRVVKTPCETCSGVGLASVRAEVEIVVPAGVESGSTRTVEGQGSVVRGKRPGDVEVTVHVRPHELFRRAGDNVICTLPVTFAQAALGDEIEIPTLEGKGTLRVPPGTQPGTTLRIRGKGIPRRVVGGRGDQLVEVAVEIPVDLTDKQKELVMELAKELGEAVQPQRSTFVEKLRALFH